MITYPDIPGIQIHPLLPSSGAALRFDLLPPLNPPPSVAAAIDHLWDDLRRRNPRLHDGPILLADTGAGMTAHGLVARRATYKTLATAADVGMDVRALGVQGVVTARDAAGEEHLLLGRRGSEVRIYQGLWENAPSGTITPPPADESFIDWAHCTRTLLDEGIEETGLNLSAANMSWIALLDDPEARSLDVVLKLDMHQPIDPRATPCPADDTHRWEYAATAWTPLNQLATWATQNAHAVSPPTRAVIRWISSA
jgi:hypothetical protein